ALALEDHVVVRVLEHRLVEHVVLETHHGAAAVDQVATQLHREAVGAGGSVERGGGRGAPVHEQLLALRREQPDAPDVVPRRVVHVQATEHHAARDRAEQGEAVLVQRHERIAFGAVLVRRGLLRALDLIELALDLGDELVQPAVEPVGVVLFPRDLPGDLFLSVVHCPASHPVRRRAAPSPGGLRVGGAQWSIMVDGPGPGRLQVTRSHSALREEPRCETLVICTGSSPPRCWRPCRAPGSRSCTPCPGWSTQATPAGSPPPTSATSCATCGWSASRPTSSSTTAAPARTRPSTGPPSRRWRSRS